MDEQLGIGLKPIFDKTTSDWQKTRLLLTLIIVAAAVSGIFFAANLVRFELLNDVQTVISNLAPLILYALFVERAVEVFLTVWRGREADILATTLQQEEKKIKDVKGADLGDFHRLQQGVTKFKATTRDIAFVWAFVIGILISLAGVRALTLFVDPTSLSELSSYQLAWFTVLDIFITGALIGGGSDGIHKIIEMFLAIMESTRARALDKVPK